jgi:CRISPR-associated protein Cas2
LKKKRVPVQYSVFSVVLSSVEVGHLMDLLEGIIDEREDDLRCYGLPSSVECITLGKQFFPDDVLLFSQGVSRLIM